MPFPMETGDDPAAIVIPQRWPPAKKRTLRTVGRLHHRADFQTPVFPALRLAAVARTEVLSDLSVLPLRQ